MTAATDSSADTDIPWRSPTFHVILASSLVGVMGVSLISPILPALRGVFGVGDAEIGLIITAYTLPGIVLTPFVGLVADRVGRRRTMVPLLVTFGVAGAAVSVADGFAQVLVLRFVQGIGASALVALAVTLIGDVYAGERRDAIMGVNASTIGAGAASYPLIGGALGAIRWEFPFVFFGVGVLVGLLAAFSLVEPDTDQSADVRTYLGGFRAILSRPQALAIFAALFAAFFVFYGAVLTALPLLLSDEFGLESTEIGPLLATSALAMALVSTQFGRIADWRSAAALVPLGFVLFGASLLGLWLAPSPLFVGAALLAFGAGFGLIMPSTDTAIVTLVSGRHRAGVMGVRTSMLRLGQTLGPVGFTYTAETAFATPLRGYRTLLVIVGTAVVAVGVVGYGLARR